MGRNDKFNFEHDDFEVSAKDSRGISSRQYEHMFGIQEGSWELIWESRASRAIIETGEVIGKQVEKKTNIVP